MPNRALVSDFPQAKCAEAPLRHRGGPHSLDTVWKWRAQRANDDTITIPHHETKNPIAVSTAARQVWGLAEAVDGQKTGSGEWTLVAVTEAAPTATLSGLREVSKCPRYRERIERERGREAATLDLMRFRGIASTLIDFPLSP